MTLSNTAVPKYYGMFRDAVIRGEIPICKEISMEMNRIDDLIANPGVYYDEDAVEGWIRFCEGEMTLTDGSDLNLLEAKKAITPPKSNPKTSITKIIIPPVEELGCII